MQANSDTASPPAPVSSGFGKPAESNHHQAALHQPQQAGFQYTSTAQQQHKQQQQQQRALVAAAAAAREERTAALVENLAQLAAAASGGSSSVAKTTSSVTSQQQQHKQQQQQLLESSQSVGPSTPSPQALHHNLARQQPAGVTAAAAGAAPVTTRALLPQPREETVFSTIGMGIIPNFYRTSLNQSYSSPADHPPCEEDLIGEDATEAACKALQDALERGMLSFAQQQQQHKQRRQQGASSSLPPPQLSIRIGVPTKLMTPQELMHVNQYRVMTQLSSFLQREGVELQHIDLTVGGLWTEHPGSSSSGGGTTRDDRYGVLAVVACLSVVQQQPPPQPPVLHALPPSANVSLQVHQERAFSPSEQRTLPQQLQAAAEVTTSAPTPAGATTLPLLSSPHASQRALPTTGTPPSAPPPAAAVTAAAAAAPTNPRSEPMEEESPYHMNRPDEDANDSADKNSMDNNNPINSSVGSAGEESHLPATAAGLKEENLLQQTDPASNSMTTSRQDSRGSSMDVLAHVSAEICDQHQQQQPPSHDEEEPDEEAEERHPMVVDPKKEAGAAAESSRTVSQRMTTVPQHKLAQPMVLEPTSYHLTHDAAAVLAAAVSMRDSSDNYNGVGSNGHNYNETPTIVGSETPLASGACGPPSSYGDKYGNNTNYKKLPPGKTPKNNNRLFVKHSYQDFSDEVPTEEENSSLLSALSSAAEKTPNAPFPLKLHETLLEIERDGYDDIVGWLPHGRSFKIHKQQEFVQLILPKYFVMTKKSSFLRQLNLYGFNRLSGVGPDQASYYHEKFLRGMKFLCRRMQRCKVNGNRIRAAGNPDGEPVLSNYPTCPLPPSDSSLMNNNGAKGSRAKNNSMSTSNGVHSESMSSSNNNGSASSSGNNNNTASVQHLATAAVLQYMAQQQHKAPAPASGIEALSSLLALVPGGAASAAPTPSTSASAAPSSNRSSMNLLEAAAAAAPSLLSISRQASAAATAAATPTSHISSTSTHMDGVASSGRTSCSRTKAERSPSMSSSSSAETNQGMGESANASNNQQNKNVTSNHFVTSFPFKLQRILDKLESDRNGAVVSWQPHGRAFMVHNSERFVNELMPLYFNQTKYSSFQRQLHMYNFQRITFGCDKGAYYHPQFQRGNPALCQKMQRTRVNGKGVYSKHPSSPSQSYTRVATADPDLSQLPPLPSVPVGSIVDLPPRVVSFSSSSSSSSASPLTAANTTALSMTTQQQLATLQQEQQHRLQQQNLEFEKHL